MTDTGGVTVTDRPQAAPAKKRRGRETVLDMVRSLGVVFLLVIPLWFFGQASPQDSKRIRPVDPADALHAFAQDTHGPVPHTPGGWVVNVARYEGSTVRIGYVVGDHYAEFAGANGTAFLAEESGKATPIGVVDVKGVSWQDLRSADGHESLVRTVGGVTVLVGGVRENASSTELRTLAATVL